MQLRPSRQHASLSYMARRTTTVFRHRTRLLLHTYPTVPLPFPAAVRYMPQHIRSEITHTIPMLAQDSMYSISTDDATVVHVVRPSGRAPDYHSVRCDACLRGRRVRVEGTGTRARSRAAAPRGAPVESGRRGHLRPGAERNKISLLSRQCTRNCSHKLVVANLYKAKRSVPIGTHIKSYSSQRF